MTFWEIVQTYYPFYLVVGFVTAVTCFSVIGLPVKRLTGFRRKTDWTIVIPAFVIVMAFWPIVFIIRILR